MNAQWQTLAGQCLPYGYLIALTATSKVGAPGDQYQWANSMMLELANHLRANA